MFALTLGICLEMEPLGHRAGYVLALEDTAEEVTKYCYQFVLPPVMNKNSGFSSSSLTVGIVLYFSHSGGCIVVSYHELIIIIVCVFLLISLK